MNPLSADEPRFIPLISDYGFKATFGNETNSLFLRRALQALIQSDIAIEQVTFLPNELSRLSKDGRSGVYDLACQDAAGNFFIVEMQLSEYPEFIQRMKFYSLYRFNTLVKKGDYSFENLPRIYCIGILAATIFPHLADYHNMATLRNQRGELVADQTTYVTVELAKFTKPLTVITSDLDKLLYTMKTLHHTSDDKIQWPEFWNEEWIKLAIEELDKRKMSPEELLQYEMTLSANALAVKNEKKKMQAITIRAVQKALAAGKLTIEEIADYNDVTVGFVLDVQRQMI